MKTFLVRDHFADGLEIAGARTSRSRTSAALSVRLEKMTALEGPAGSFWISFEHALLWTGCPSQGWWAHTLRFGAAGPLHRHVEMRRDSAHRALPTPFFFFAAAHRAPVESGRALFPPIWIKPGSRHRRESLSSFVEGSPAPWWRSTGVLVISLSTAVGGEKLRPGYGRIDRFVGQTLRHLPHGSVICRSPGPQKK